jgi:hypothetical protein
MGKLKRNRKIRTCEYCYNHKLKCDRNSPCSTCVRTKNECVYQFNQLTKSDDDSTSIITKNKFKKNNETDNNNNNNNNANNRNNDNNDGDDSNINKIFHEISETPKNAISGSNDHTNLNGSNQENNTEIGLGKQPKIEFSSNVNNTPLYYSRAFFPYLEPSLNRMFLFKMSEVGETSALNQHYSSLGTYDFQRFGLDFSLDNLIKEYPKKEEFDNIIYLYWDYIHPLIPVIDKEITMSKYINFWQDLHNVDEPTFDIDSGVLFISMLLAVKTAFEVNESSPEKLKIIQDEKNKLHDTFEKFKLIFGFKTNLNLAYIQASIILFQSSAIYYLGIFTYTAALTRQAEYMGLHRDPLLHDVYPNQRQIRDVETRRTIWHYIRFLDTSASIVSGMSPHLIMINASCKFPSKRDYNSESHKFDGELNPFMIFTISRFKCSLVMETISHYLNSDFSSENEKILRWESISKTVIALYQDVYSLIKEIFSCSSNAKYSKVLLRWLVSNAAIFVHRTYLLHRTCDRRPYSHHNRVILKPANASSVELTKLSQSNSSKDFFERVLTIRMPYFEATIEVSILLLYETKIRVGVSPELAKFKWFTKNANPFQYVYFVLRDMYHYPDKRYKFEHLPKEIKNFIFEREILEFEGDLRKHVVDTSLNALLHLKDYWCEPIGDMMNFLFELKKFVYKTIDIPNNNDDNAGTNNTKESGDNIQNSLDQEFEFNKYKSIMHMLSTFNGDAIPPNANTSTLDSGSGNKEINSISSILNESNTFVPSNLENNVKLNTKTNFSNPAEFPHENRFYNFQAQNGFQVLSNDYQGAMASSITSQMPLQQTSQINSTLNIPTMQQQMQQHSVIIPSPMLPRQEQPSLDLRQYNSDPNSMMQQNPLHYYQIQDQMHLSMQTQIESPITTLNHHITHPMVPNIQNMTQNQEQSTSYIQVLGSIPPSVPINNTGHQLYSAGVNQQYSIPNGEPGVRFNYMSNSDHNPLPLDTPSNSDNNMGNMNGILPGFN